MIDCRRLHIAASLHKTLPRLVGNFTGHMTIVRIVLILALYLVTSPSLQLLFQRNDQLSAMREAAEREARFLDDIRIAGSLFTEHSEIYRSSPAAERQDSIWMGSLPVERAQNVTGGLSGRDDVEHTHLLPRCPQAAKTSDRSKFSDKDQLDSRLRALKLRSGGGLDFGRRNQAQTRDCSTARRIHAVRAESRSYLASIRYSLPPHFTAAPAPEAAETSSDVDRLPPTADRDFTAQPGVRSAFSPYSVVNASYGGAPTTSSALDFLDRRQTGTRRASLEDSSSGRSTGDNSVCKTPSQESCVCNVDPDVTYRKRNTGSGTASGREMGSSTAQSDQASPSPGRGIVEAQRYQHSPSALNGNFQTQPFHHSPSSERESYGIKSHENSSFAQRGNNQTQHYQSSPLPARSHYEAPLYPNSPSPVRGSCQVQSYQNVFSPMKGNHKIEPYQHEHPSATGNDPAQPYQNRSPMSQSYEVQRNPTPASGRRGICEEQPDRSLPQSRESYTTQSDIIISHQRENESNLLSHSFTHSFIQRDEIYEVHPDQNSSLQGRETSVIGSDQHPALQKREADTTQLDQSSASETIAFQKSSTWHCHMSVEGKFEVGQVTNSSQIENFPTQSNRFDAVSGQGLSSQCKENQEAQRCPVQMPKRTQNSGIQSEYVSPSGMGGMNEKQPEYSPASDRGCIPREPLSPWKESFRFVSVLPQTDRTKRSQESQPGKKDVSLSNDGLETHSAQASPPPRKVSFKNDAHPDHDQSSQRFARRGSPPVDPVKESFTTQIQTEQGWTLERREVSGGMSVRHTALKRRSPTESQSNRSVEQEDTPRQKYSRTHEMNMTSWQNDDTQKEGSGSRRCLGNVHEEKKIQRCTACHRNTAHNARGSSAIVSADRKLDRCGRGTSCHSAMSGTASATTQISFTRSVGVNFNSEQEAIFMASPCHGQLELSTSGRRTVSATQTDYQAWFSEFQESVGIQTCDYCEPTERTRQKIFRVRSNDQALGSRPTVRSRSRCLPGESSSRDPARRERGRVASVPPLGRRSSGECFTLSRFVFGTQTSTSLHSLLSERGDSLCSVSVTSVQENIIATQTNASVLDLDQDFTACDRDFTVTAPRRHSRTVQTAGMKSGGVRPQDQPCLRARYVSSHTDGQVIADAAYCRGTRPDASRTYSRTPVLKNSSRKRQRASVPGTPPSPPCEDSDPLTSSLSSLASDLDSPGPLPWRWDSGVDLSGRSPQQLDSEVDVLCMAATQTSPDRVSSGSSGSTKKVKILDTNRKSSLSRKKTKTSPRKRRESKRKEISRSATTQTGVARVSPTSSPCRRSPCSTPPEHRPASRQSPVPLDLQTFTAAAQSAGLCTSGAVNPEVVETRVWEILSSIEKRVQQISEQASSNLQSLQSQTSSPPTRQRPAVASSPPHPGSRPASRVVSTTCVVSTSAAVLTSSVVAASGAPPTAESGAPQTAGAQPTSGVSSRPGNMTPGSSSRPKSSPRPAAAAYAAPATFVQYPCCASPPRCTSPAVTAHAAPTTFVQYPCCASPPRCGSPAPCRSPAYAAVRTRSTTTLTTATTDVRYVPPPQCAANSPCVPRSPSPRLEAACTSPGPCCADMTACPQNLNPATLMPPPPCSVSISPPSYCPAPSSLPPGAFPTSITPCISLSPPPFPPATLQPPVLSTNALSRSLSSHCLEVNYAASDRSQAVGALQNHVSVLQASGPAPMCSLSPCPSPVCSRSPCPSPLCSRPPCPSPVCVSPAPYFEEVWYTVQPPAPRPPPPYCGRPTAEMLNAYVQHSSPAAGPCLPRSKSRKKDRGKAVISRTSGKSSGARVKKSSSARQQEYCYAQPGTSGIRAETSPTRLPYNHSQPRSGQGVTEDAESDGLSSWIPGFLQAVSPPTPRRRLRGIEKGDELGNGQEKQSSASENGEQRDPFIM